MVKLLPSSRKLVSLFSEHVAHRETQLTSTGVFAQDKMLDRTDLAPWSATRDFGS